MATVNMLVGTNRSSIQCHFYSPRPLASISTTSTDGFIVLGRTSSSSSKFQMDGMMWSKWRTKAAARWARTVGNSEPHFRQATAAIAHQCCTLCFILFAATNRLIRQEMRVMHDRSLLPGKYAVAMTKLVQADIESYYNRMLSQIRANVRHELKAWLIFLIKECAEMDIQVDGRTVRLCLVEQAPVQDVRATTPVTCNTSLDGDTTCSESEDEHPKDVQTVR